MIKTWFKLFVRNSKKNWLHTLINISGLTLGLVGLLIVLLYFNEENSYDQWNPYKDDIYRVTHRWADGEVTRGTVGEASAFKEEISEVDDTYLSGAWYEETLVKAEGKTVYIEDVLSGQSNFFDFFPFKIIAGSAATFSQSTNNIALSKEQAAVLFGEASALGKTIEIEGEVYIVTTVFEIQGNSFFEPNIIRHFETEPPTNWGAFGGVEIFCKFNKKVVSKDVVTKMDAVLTKYRSIPFAERQGVTVEDFEEQYGLKPVLENIKDIRLKSEVGGPEGQGDLQLLYVLLGLSTLLILISCVNVINLSTASVTQRAKEVGIKKTLGLSKKRLYIQYLLEITLQCFIAFIFALILVELLLPSFNEFMSLELALFNSRIILQAGGATLLVALITGSIPALYMSNFKSIEVLKGNISRSKKGIVLRHTMLGLQFIISGAFLTGVLIVLLQINFMMKKDLGFSGEQVLLVFMNDENNRYQKYQLAKSELINHPAIEAVTSTSIIPGSGGMDTYMSYLDKDIRVFMNFVDYESFDVLNIPVLKGRLLSDKFASDTINNVLINETLAKQFGIYDDPIGKTIKNSGTEGAGFNIIGMVQDYHFHGFDREIDPMFITHWNASNQMREYISIIQFKINLENITETIAYIEDYWQKNIEQGYPFTYEFADDQFAEGYEDSQRQKTIFIIITSVVILIGLLGLFALATLSIQQRLKEVAIRKTLGASIKSIVMQLIKDFLKVVLISSVILIPIIYYVMQNWLNNFVYRIEMPWWPFIATPILLILLVFAVVGLKAFNATKVDLIKYLKFE